MKIWYTYQITEYRHDGSYEVYYWDRSPRFSNKKTALKELKEVSKRFDKSEDCKICYADVLKWDETGEDGSVEQFTF